MYIVKVGEVQRKYLDEMASAFPEQFKPEPDDLYLQNAYHYFTGRSFCDSRGCQLSTETSGGDKDRW